MARRPKHPQEPPPPPHEPLTRERVLEAVNKAGGAAAKRDLAKLLNVPTSERSALRAILKELEDEGLLGRTGRRAFASATALPESGLLEVVALDADGEPLGQMRGRDGLFGPRVRIAPERGRPAALGMGDRAIVRIAKTPEGPIAKVIKKISAGAPRLLGVFHAFEDPRAPKGAKTGGGRVEPADKKLKQDLIVFPENAAGAKDGDLVVVEALSGDRASYGPRRGAVREIIGHADDPRAASILAIHSHGIPIGFSEEEEEEAKAAKKPTLKGRTDLRDLPLLTIDPEDARDHDDAVFARPDDDPKNKGGIVAWVAIADVSAYVRPNSALDRGALKRGNSTYFPDRVAPMLPEALSADLCSLREGENRACLAVEMIFNKDGHKLRHRFVRGLMRSAAKLSYAQAQKAFDGEPDDKAAPLVKEILAPLWNAYEVLKRGREARAPLALESLERRVKFGPDGRIAAIQRREVLPSNQLIEEFMIQANVCAAETLEAKNLSVIYRVHDTPSEEKIAALVNFLHTVDLKWAKGQVVMPVRFNRLLEQARETEHFETINEVVLRTQAQAIYHPENIGHFGLNLARYAHFTSPIRRYADLVVHRGLIRALNLGDDGLTDGEIARLDEIADHITMTERRSMAAEREAMDRYLAAYLADHVGDEFAGRVSGVTRFGLFVKLDDTGADGLVPVSTLGAQRFEHDEAAHALVGASNGARYQLGMPVAVRIAEAAPVSGGLVFELTSDALPPAREWKRRPPSRRPPPPARGKPSRRPGPSRGKRK